MRNLAVKYLESYKDWGCMGQQGMVDILVGFAELVVAQKTPTNSKSMPCEGCKALDECRPCWEDGRCV